MSKQTKVKAESKNSLPGITKKDKAKRSKYLYRRINQLFSEMSVWLKESKEYKVKISSINVEKEKLPMAEIYFEKNKIVSLKPAALWAFGVNIRMDLISEKENNILFDTAKESDSPDWILVPSQPGKGPKKFTKIIFKNLLKKLNQN